MMSQLSNWLLRSYFITLVALWSIRHRYFWQRKYVPEGFTAGKCEERLDWMVFWNHLVLVEGRSENWKENKFQILAVFDCVPFDHFIQPSRKQPGRGFFLVTGWVVCLFNRFGQSHTITTVAQCFRFLWQCFAQSLVTFYKVQIESHSDWFISNPFIHIRVWRQN